MVPEVHIFCVTMGTVEVQRGPGANASDAPSFQYGLFVEASFVERSSVCLCLSFAGCIGAVLLISVEVFCYSAYLIYFCMGFRRDFGAICARFT